MNAPIPRRPLPHTEARDSARIANAIFLTGTVFGMGLMFLILQIWRPGEQQDLAHYRQVRDLVMDTFVAPVDEQQLLESSLRGMLQELDDYSAYYVRDEAAELNQETSGRKVGIGVIMRYTDGPQILFPIEGSPAQAAGLRVGDLVLELDGRRVAGLSQAEVGDAMRGDAGSTLRILVRGRDGSQRLHEVTRGELLIPSVRHGRLVDMERGIGYVALASFTNATTTEFDSAMVKLRSQGVQGLVIDLRGNPGGVLSAAVELAQRFISEGILTSTEGRGVPHVERADADFTPYEGLPLVLLVNGMSASASEVFAGALQDHRVAVLVGEPTYGKGVVQTISHYPDQHAIAKVTTSYYYTPAHRSLVRGSDKNAFGLLPDFLVTDNSDEIDKFYAWLQRPYDPQDHLLDELVAWQDAERLDFGLNLPRDTQLDAALSILRGQAPAFAR